MKALKLNYIILIITALVFSNVSVFAQQDDSEKDEKEIVIIKETVDEDGKVTTKKIVKKGDVEGIVIESIEGQDINFYDLEDAEDIHVIELENLEGLTDEMKEKLKNIEIDIDEDGTNRHIKIIMDKIGDDGEPVIIEWEGEGEIPEDIKKKLHKNGGFGGNFDHDFHGNDFVFNHHESNKACLGVMIGKTVENENGVETVRGESDQGVTVLDIIENSGAQEAGLLKDDIITAIGGTGVASIQDVLDVLKPYEGGATVSIDYLRNNQPAQVTATLKACENKMKIKHFEDHEGNNFEFDEDMDWTIENEEEGTSQHKRIIVIKKSMKSSEETEDTNTFVEEKDDLGTDTPGDTVTTSAKNLDQSLELKQFNAFPNPTAGNLNVEFEGEAVPTIVQVLDIAGKVIYSEELIDFDGFYKKEINLENAPKGTLMLTVQQNDKVFAEKLVAQ